MVGAHKISIFQIVKTRKFFEMVKTHEIFQVVESHEIYYIVETYEFFQMVDTHKLYEMVETHEKSTFHMEFFRFGQHRSCFFLNGRYWQSISFTNNRQS